MTRSLIEWTNETWNPVRGCSRVSTGCQNCYAKRMAHRFSGPGQPYEGLTTLRNGRPAWTGSVRFVPEMLDMPLRWRKPRMVFVNSMSDLFHERVSDDDIDDVFGVMWACEYLGRGDNVYPGHIFQVLTKRAERMRDYLSQDRRERWAYAAVRNGCAGEDPDPLWDQINFAKHQHPRIWLGVSVEGPDQLWRLDELRRVPAAVHFVSLEPLIAPVSIAGHIDFLDWVIIGGESGPGARPCDLHWIRSIVGQCRTARVPVFVKQLGSNFGYDDGHGHVRCGSGKNNDPSVWPEDLRVREWPRVAA